MSSPDVLTVDAFPRPPGGRIRWRRHLRHVIDDGIDGIDAPPYPQLPGARRAGL